MLAPPLASLLATVVVAAAPPSGASERWMFAGHPSSRPAVVSFTPHAISPNAVRSAWVTTGRRSRRVARSRLVHGLDDGGLRVRLGGALRRASRERLPWLVVRTRPFGEFDGYSAQGGALRRNWRRAYEGSSSIEASFSRAGGGFARTWQKVAWSDGDEVVYRMALRIPHSARWCYWNPVRWDNYARFGSGGDVGGIRIQEGRLSLIRARYGEVEEALTVPVVAPRGRWFSLEVRQRLSDGPDALNEILIDGRRVAASTAPNSYGRRVDNVRFGAVNVAGSCSGPGKVLFDAVSAGPR